MFWEWMYWFSGLGQPLDPKNPSLHVDVERPTVRRLLAAGIRADRRERLGRVYWSYSRDRVVERRELRAESPELKAARLEQAFRDRYQKLRMVS